MGLAAIFTKILVTLKTSGFDLALSICVTYFTFCIQFREGFCLLCFDLEICLEMLNAATGYFCLNQTKWTCKCFTSSSLPNVRPQTIQTKCVETGQYFWLFEISKTNAAFVKIDTDFNIARFSAHHFETRNSIYFVCLLLFLTCNQF